MSDEEARLLEKEQAERRQLLLRLRLLDAGLVKHDAMVDITEAEAADMRLDRLRRVVDATEEHLAQIIEAERMIVTRTPRPPRSR